VDGAGDAYVVGDTVRTTGYPLKDALQSTFGGGLNDATVAKLDATGHLVYSTLLGGRGRDRGQAIAIDSTGNAYVAIETSSPNLPHISAVQPRFGGGRDDTYVAKLAADGRAQIYGTYLGGAGNDTPYGIAVDSVGNAYLTGITRSADFPLVHPLPGQDQRHGTADAFVSILNPVGTLLAFSTYLGGAGDDFGTGIGLDARGSIYISGQTNSTDLASKGVAQSALSGSYDAFVAKISRALSGKE
jgi:hypothetical protein